jgi:integrase
VITEQEVKSIMERLNIRDKVLVLTGLSFGTRISETLELKFKNVEGNEVYINSKKGSEKTSFPISEQYKQAVSELKEEYIAQGKEVSGDTYLFLSRKGQNEAITRIQASRIIKETCTAIGIDGKVNTHSFRKSFVTKIYNLTNYNIAETKKYSRHKSLANLDYYIGTTEGRNLTAGLSW